LRVSPAPYATGVSARGGDQLAFAGDARGKHGLQASSVEDAYTRNAENVALDE
jgi:hypothetical protein